MAEGDMLRKSSGLGMLLANLGMKNQDNTSTASGEKQNDQSSTARNHKSADNSTTSDHAPKQRPAKRSRWNPPDESSKWNPPDENMDATLNVSSWGSMKQYDDDNDNQWFEDENARLAELYGGNFIYAKYLDSQPGKIGYYCELCYAEMNARKSLDLHCSGMKHLKKKAIWEKRDGHEQRPEREVQPPHKVLRQGQCPPPHHPPPQDWHNRDLLQMDFRGYRPPKDRLPYREPPHPEFRDNRGYYDRRDNSDRYPDDYYRTAPMSYRSQYDEGSSYGRTGSPGQRNYNSPPGPDRRDTRDQYSQKYVPYGRREAPPPPVISGPDLPGRSEPPSQPQHTGGVTLMQQVSQASLFEGISDGSCSQLLKSLAVCRVKNKEDAILATNVTTFLTMSLKDYYSSIGQSSVSHILEEIIIKINIVKDLLKVSPH